LKADANQRDRMSVYKLMNELRDFQKFQKQEGIDPRTGQPIERQAQ